MVGGLVWHRPHPISPYFGGRDRRACPKSQEIPSNCEQDAERSWACCGVRGHRSPGAAAPRRRERARGTGAPGPEGRTPHGRRDRRQGRPGRADDRRGGARHRPDRPRRSSVRRRRSRRRPVDGAAADPAGDPPGRLPGAGALRLAGDAGLAHAPERRRAGATSDGPDRRERAPRRAAGRAAGRVAGPSGLVPGGDDARPPCRAGLRRARALRPVRTVRLRAVQPAGPGRLRPGGLWPGGLRPRAVLLPTGRRPPSASAATAPPSQHGDRARRGGRPRRRDGERRHRRRRLGRIERRRLHLAVGHRRRPVGLRLRRRHREVRRPRRRGHQHRRRPRERRRPGGRHRA